MRMGLSPQEAAEDAVRRIALRTPAYVGALVAVDRCGRRGAAAFGWNFSYAFQDAASQGVQVEHVAPLTI